ncbi:peptidoglycan-binding protein [Minwuia sp.]|uniref:peptidoglycan-binding protein n=1 Tax=Minwuia sp. TaxID=2493630 RepID=UPI003A92ADD1
MKSTAPWSVKGIEPEAREVAKAKAKAAGMTLGQWLNQAIADAGQPQEKPAEPQAPTGSALDTARIMRAIAELARRVDLVSNAQGSAPPASTELTTRMASLDERLQRIAEALPAQPALPDQSRLERGLVAIAKKIDQLEKNGRSDPTMLALRSDLQALKTTTSGTATDMTPVNNALARLNERLAAIQALVEAPDPADVPSERAEAALESVSGDLRKLMNGMVNLAAKIDRVEQQVDERLAPLQNALDRLESAARPSRDTDDQAGREQIQAAVQAAIAPLALSLNSLAGQIDDLREAGIAQDIDDHQGGIDESLAEHAHPVHEPETDSFESEDTMAAVAAPAVEHEAERATAEEAPPSPAQPLHDLTSGDDVRVRRIEDDETFFRDLDTGASVSEEPPETADPVPGEEAREPQPAARETISLSAVPDEAAPPDRPKRLVPVESLLAGPVGSEPADDRVHEDAPIADPPQQDETPSSTMPPLSAGDRSSGPDVSERRSFRLDEPLDLSRSASGADPDRYDRRRPWIGYLVAALVFLALLIGGFWFAGTPQFDRVASQASTAWDNLMARIEGVELSDTPEGTPNEGGSETLPSSATATDQTPGSEGSPGVDATPPQDTTPAPSAAISPPPIESAPVAEDPAPASAPEAPAAETAPAAQTEIEKLTAEARAGDMDAQYALGVRYRDGIGVAPDYSTAADWFDLAAQQGHVQSQLGLGVMYRQGLGRPRDLDLAKLWLHAAARAGNPDAQKYLGEVYVDDRAGVPDYFQAARWFREAAEQGVVDAQYNMGVLYEGGLGVPRNFSQAYYWFSLASMSGDAGAVEDVRRVASLLTPEERAEIDAEIAAFEPSSAVAESPAETTGTDAAASEGQPITRRDQVRLIQQLLIARGYDPGAPDGLPGSKTREAIRLWQADNGLPVTGRMTEALLTRLQQSG